MSSKKKDLTSLISSAVSAASVSDLSEQTPLFGRLPFASAKPIPKPSLKSTGLTFPSTTMSEHYKQIDLEELTSSQGATLANHSALPENNSERKMTAISGRKWLGLFDNATPLGCLQKMLLVTSQWASTKCYLTWKAKGTPQGRLLFQLVPLVRRTDETGSGLWLTPTTNESVTNLEKFKKRMEKYDNGTTMPNLATQVSERLLPTPRTRGLLGGTGSKEMMKAAVEAGLSTREEAERMMGLKMWPTPTTQEIEHPNLKLNEAGRRLSQDGEKSHSLNLADKVKMWPTPAATDYKGSGKTGELRDRLDYAVERGATKSKTYEKPQSEGSLNPAWVEALMGFPPGWTALGKTEYQEYQKAKKAAQKGSKG